jgi:hypothetical protein
MVGEGEEKKDVSLEISGGLLGRLGSYYQVMALTTVDGSP